MPRRRTVILGVASLLAAAALSVFITLRVRSNRVAGIYLSSGGQGYIEIVPDGLWKWRVRRQRVHPMLDFEVVSGWPNLRLHLFLPPGRIPDLAPMSREDFDSYLSFKPSHLLRKGWDLVEVSYTVVTTGTYWVEGQPPRNTDPSRPPYEQKARRPSRPLPFLYRLDDRRIVEYFALQYNDKNPEAAFEMAGALLDAHPDDLQVRAIYLAAAAYCDNVAEVGRRLEQWKDDFRKSKNPYPLGMMLSLESWHRAARLSATGENAYDFCHRIFGTETDVATRLRLLPNLFDYPAYLPPYLPDIGTDALPGLLHMQLSGKVHLILSVFMMLEGRQQECLDLLSATFRLGQLMSKGGPLMQRLVGLAISSFAAKGFEVYALNCCESDTEFEHLWQTLSRLEANQDPNRLADLMEIEPALELYVDQSELSTLRQNTTRVNLADSRFELVRMAAVAKHRLLADGRFPASNDQFAPFLPHGPPNDPFSDGPLRFVETTDSLICYSVGPDRRDNRAAIEYDPTNGTVSGGDITLRVPRERQYPFPRDGVRAASIDDLRRQFPNGLPRDPFATNIGRGLSAAESADGRVYVWSFGPDVDEYKDPVPLAFHSVPATGTVLFQREIDPRRWPLPPHRLQVPYDPTNGIVSEGDLFILIPPP